MKKYIILLILLAPTLFAHSQVTTKTLKKNLTLLMPRTTEDSMPGTRGASVVWHPLQKKYYAAMAGNIRYPMGVYNAAGKLLSPESLNTNEDVRGLWYNPVKKQIQGNSYSDYGWFYYNLDARGIPLESYIFKEGMNQPNDQVVGAFSIARQQVLFLASGMVYFYNANGEQLDNPLRIYWGRTKKDGISEDETDEPSTPQDYNYTTLVFTGISGAELGFLNISNMQIELYNMADGFMTQVLKLPEDAAMNQSFNFAYTNGMYWLFNIELRTWTGYK